MMTTEKQGLMVPKKGKLDRIGAAAAFFTAAAGTITLGFALTAVPISGANCPGNCIDYPYLDTAAQFPKDFIWMPLAILFLLGYLGLSSVIAQKAAEENKLFAQIGRSLAGLSTGTLMVNYYLQFFVIPMSLNAGETEGIPLLIQYNPHGIFLILEEFGYLVLSLSFLFFAAVLTNRSRLELAAKRIFQGGFGLVALAFLVISIVFGLNRQDHFEVIAISVDWLVMIVNGILLGKIFSKEYKK